MSMGIRTCIASTLYPPSDCIYSVNTSCQTPNPEPLSSRVRSVSRRKTLGCTMTFAPQQKQPGGKGLSRTEKGHRLISGGHPAADPISAAISSENTPHRHGCAQEHLAHPSAIPVHTFCRGTESGNLKPTVRLSAPVKLICPTSSSLNFIIFADSASSYP